VSAAPTSSFARPLITALRDGKGIAKLKASVDKVVKKIQPALVPIKAKLKRLEDQPLKDWQIYVAAGGITVLDVCVVSFLRITSGELLVERFPILTNAMQGALLVLSGDLVAQMALRSARGVKEARLDTTRLAKAAAVGVVNVGLWPYYWYWLIDSLLPSQAPADLWYPAWLLEWSLLGVPAPAPSPCSARAPAGSRRRPSPRACALQPSKLGWTRSSTGACRSCRPSRSGRCLTATLSSPCAASCRRSSARRGSWTGRSGRSITSSVSP
jgi:hypothetical protein